MLSKTPRNYHDSYPSRSSSRQSSSLSNLYGFIRIFCFRFALDRHVSFDVCSLNIFICYRFSIILLNILCSHVFIRCTASVCKRLQRTMKIIFERFFPNDWIERQTIRDEIETRRFEPGTLFRDVVSREWSPRYTWWCIPRYMTPNVWRYCIRSENVEFSAWENDTNCIGRVTEPMRFFPTPTMALTKDNFPVRIVRK